MIFGTHDIIAQKKIVKNIFTFPQITSFVFFVLLALSLGFYVSADEQSGSREYSLFRDADQDGLSDEEEKVFGTDPFVRDTDGDSYSEFDARIKEYIEILESSYDKKKILIVGHGDVIRSIIRQYTGREFQRIDVMNVFVCELVPNKKAKGKYIFKEVN